MDTSIRSKENRSCAQFPRLLGNSKGTGIMSRQKNNARAGSSRACVHHAPPAAAPKGAISMLQEYVQCSYTFHLPSNYTVLQWSFDTQMADAATLEFRATVAFLLEGVPHHVVGTWQPKKRDAQRDAAERALNLFVQKWGKEMPQERQNHQASDTHSQSAKRVGQLDVDQLLADHCEHLDKCGGIPPSSSIVWDGETCRATVEITLLGVPHQFAGSPQSTEDKARADAARRVLWYLECPGFCDAYEPDPLSAAIVNRMIPAPPVNWARGSLAEAALEVAERKTALMRVQNRLQQTFSHELRPGMSVWAWDCKMDPNDEDWPTLCQASVSIPVIRKTFTGSWRRGQRDAQLDTIQQITRFLDEREQ